MLYLPKSAVTNEYLQENLHILAAPDGDEVTIGYAARWVNPELWGQVGRGAKACLIFGARPYPWFVPVRRAEVVGVVDEAGELTVTVQLGPFARGMNLEAFGQRFAELNRRRFFVVRDSKPEIAFVSEGEDNLGNWKRIVEALQSSPGDDYTSRYARSVFLRYMPLCNAYGQPFPPGGQLEVGQLYQQPSQGQVDYVIDFVRSGAYRSLEDDCQQAGVTYVRVPRSRSLDQIVRALARVHGIELG